MTSREIQRMMDFILRSQADSVIRMERWAEERKRFDEKFETRDAKLQQELRKLHNDVTALVRERRAHEMRIRTQERAVRAHEKRIRTQEKSARRRDDRFKGVTDIVRILTRLGAVQSKRIDEIEKRNSD